ncbi:hypothetical protein K474DRAFT_1677267 [Panus rudis PR-1116 ss-1]|nr:hypothetical protein K474DRAFT_1677267 [Panus rudis PR-1116 ss-1]
MDPELTTNWVVGVNAAQAANVPVQEVLGFVLIDTTPDETIEPEKYGPMRMNFTGQLGDSETRRTMMTKRKNRRNSRWTLDVGSKQRFNESPPEPKSWGEGVWMGRGREGRDGGDGGDSGTTPSRKKQNGHESNNDIVKRRLKKTGASGWQVESGVTEA